MGLSSSRSRSSTSSNSVSTPRVPSFIEGPFRDFSSQLTGAMSDMGDGTRVGPSALQQQAFAGASGLGGFQDALRAALSGSQGLMNFTPQNVNAGQLRDTDLSPYMNPYTDAVVDTTMRDLERMRAGAISSGQGAATLSGAYGGSRHGVADAETNRGFLDTASAAIANLRNTGFQNAQQAALADIGNRLNADTGNADRNLAGAGLQLAAANQAGSQALAGDASTRADLAQTAALGDTQRDIDIQNDPNEARMRALAQLAALLSAFNGYPIGQEVNQSGTTTTTSSPSGIGMLGTAISGIGSLFPSDRRLKRDMTPLGYDAKGLRWWAFRYLWDGPGAMQIGVMADEAPAHAVHIGADGYALVDYGAL